MGNTFWGNLAVLWLMFIGNAELQTTEPTIDLLSTRRAFSDSIKTSFPIIMTPTTKSGKFQVEMGEAEEPAYTRIIPAVLTIGIFFVGFVVIYVLYYQKVQENKKKKEAAAANTEEDKGPEDWLSQLRRTQKRKSLGSVLTRRGSTFQMKLKIKKYALYDDMLNKYKRTLKMQKLHSMRKTTTTVSNVSNSFETNEEEGTLTVHHPPPIRKVSSKLRMKELAMRHKISQEHGFDIHLEPPGGIDGRGGGDPASWGSISQDDDSTSGRFRSHSEMEAFRDGFCKTIDYSPGTSFQLSIDYDTDASDSIMMTSFNAPPTPNKSRVSWRAPPVSLDQVETSLSVEDARDAIYDDSRDATKKDAQENELGFVNADLVEEKMENDTKSLFEKVNNDTIEGNSVSNEVAPHQKVKTNRPKSMGPISPNSARPFDRATQKRLSWYQGLFRNSPVERSDDSSGAAASVDDLIERQVNKAIFSRLAENPSVVEQDSDSNTKERRRPKSWMPVSENQRRKKKHEDTITKLFANLMELPEARAREEVLNEETTSDRNVMRTSTEDVVKRLIDIIDRNYGSGGATHAQSDVITAADSTTMPMMTEREEELMIDEVERRIIENLEDTTLYDDSEVTILENLLDDVVRFCGVYSEENVDDFGYEGSQDNTNDGFSLDREHQDLAMDFQGNQDPCQGVAANEEENFMMHETRLTIPHREHPTTTSL